MELEIDALFIHYENINKNHTVLTMQAVYGKPWYICHWLCYTETDIVVLCIYYGNINKDLNAPPIQAAYVGHDISAIYCVI